MKSKAPFGGKGRCISLRITAETRQAIDVMAQRTGYSRSHIAEMWIRDGERLDRLLRLLVPAEELLGLFDSKRREEEPT